MKELILDSIYTVEPKGSALMWNDGHWNYQWNGRKSIHHTSKIRWREESNGIFTVCDCDGKIWSADKLELEQMLRSAKN